MACVTLPLRLSHRRIWLSLSPDAATSSLFFFNDTATTEIYTLSLHDALPICASSPTPSTAVAADRKRFVADPFDGGGGRSEEHTSELQSPDHLVCRLLLEKKKPFRFIIQRHPRRTRSRAEHHRHAVHQLVDST